MKLIFNLKFYIQIKEVNTNLRYSLGFVKKKAFNNNSRKLEHHHKMVL
jgi:hypothetical protein